VSRPSWPCLHGLEARATGKAQFVFAIYSPVTLKKFKYQKAKCKIKESVAVELMFHNFDFLFLIFAF